MGHSRRTRSAGWAVMAAAAAVAVIAAGALTPPAAAQDAATVGAAVYKVVFENDHVRMMEVRIAKGAEVAMHSHPDHSAYVIKGGALRFTAQDGSTTDVEFKPGQVMYVPAQAHSARNIGKSEMFALVTEFKDAAEAKSQTLSAFERAELLEMLERSRRQTEELVGQAAGDLFTKKPGPDRWSVGEVLEHLGAAEKMLVGMAQGSLTAAPDPLWRTIAAARTPAQLFGTLTDRSQKFQAPEPLRPAGKMGRAELLAAFGGARAATIDFVRSTQAPLHAHTVQLPFGKVTVHQFLVFVAGHNMRHNAQMAEALAQVGGK